VRAVVVEDQVHVEMGGDLGVEEVEELLALNGTVTLVPGADDLAGGVSKAAKRLVVPWRW
jgi:hypothetical protein